MKQHLLTGALAALASSMTACGGGGGGGHTGSGQVAAAPPQPGIYASASPGQPSLQLLLDVAGRYAIVADKFEVASDSHFNEVVVGTFAAAGGSLVSPGVIAHGVQQPGFGTAPLPALGSYTLGATLVTLTSTPDKVGEADLHFTASTLTPYAADYHLTLQVAVNPTAPPAGAPAPVNWVLAANCSFSGTIANSTPPAVLDVHGTLSGAGCEAAGFPTGSADLVGFEYVPVSIHHMPESNFYGLAGGKPVRITIGNAALFF